LPKTSPVARRPSRPFELLAGIERLQTTGYTTKTIAEKTGLSEGYVKSILHLLKEGEERLLAAVEQGKLPLTAALAIAEAGEDQVAVQTALHLAYESGEIRGKQLILARHIVSRRKIAGKALTRGGSNKKYDKKPLTPSSLIRTYQNEVERQRRMVRKADFAQQRLLFIAEALHQLLADEHFFNLLRAERLDTMPAYLADRVWSKGSTDE
jgi:ParB family chromosome partitioning protein